MTRTELTILIDLVNAEWTRLEAHQNELKALLTTLHDEREKKFGDAS